MILLTRLNGQPFLLNPDLLERAEATPDTVLSLVDGSKFVVSQSLTDVMTAVVEFRASVVARAQRISGDAAQPAEPPHRAAVRALPKSVPPGSSDGPVPLRRRSR